jgi:hypothetical protein
MEGKIDQERTNVSTTKDDREQINKKEHLMNKDKRFDRNR